MKACLDVAYGDDVASAACVLFNDWSDENAADILTAEVKSIAPYVPGSFYLREVPCLLSVLKQVAVPLDAVVVDGYVWLGEKKWLGAHLFEAMGGGTPVIGVAKTAFNGATPYELVRNQARPLYITAAGMELNVAADCIAKMHGPSRMPALLKRVDTACREGLKQMLQDAK